MAKFSLSDSIQGLGRCISYYPSLAAIIGIKESLFLCQILYWTPKSDNGWVYKSAEDIQSETGLTYKEQTRVRASLIEQKVLIEEYRRQEHCLYFKVDKTSLDKLGEILCRDEENEEHLTNGHMPKGQMPLDQRSDGTLPKVISYIEQEITQENTQESRSSRCAKRTGKKEKKPPHPLHEPVKAHLTRYWEKFNKVNMPWDGSDGKHLNTVLSASPDMTEKDWLECLYNRARSPGVNHNARPRVWLSSLIEFNAGPKGKFNGRAQQRTQSNLAVLGDFVARGTGEKPDDRQRALRSGDHEGST